MKPNPRDAFTLIELILYVGIMSVILITISISLDTLVKSETKSRTVTEVEQQGLSAMDIITRTIRSATEINSPTPGVSGATLSLAIGAPNNPTIFRVSSSTLEMKEGVGSYIALTNSQVEVSGLEIQNLSRGNTPGIVSVMFTITSINASTRGEYSYNKTFRASANIRK